MVTVARALRIRDVHEDIMGLVDIVLRKVDAERKDEVLLVRSPFVEGCDLRTSPVWWEDTALLVYGVVEETLCILRGGQCTRSSENNEREERRCVYHD